jgi:hypothetical protein
MDEGRDATAAWAGHAVGDTREVRARNLPGTLEGAVVLIDEPLDDGCRTSAFALNHALSLNGT